jgi:ParB family transcriptional regulator, chromosome partitioning protein
VPKRLSLHARASEFAQSDATADRPTPELHGAERPHQDVIAIPIREIMPNAHQPRTRFDEVALEELAESIRAHGVIQPILIQPIHLTNWEGAVRRFTLIAGERRWRASERAGLTMIPAIIRDEASDTARIELALIENLQRADLTPLEEATAFSQMQRDLGYTYDQIGQRVGKSKGYVMNRMRLLRLDDDLRDLVAERPDALSHIIHLEKLPREQREELVASVRDDDLSVAEVRRRAEAFLRKNTDLTEQKIETPLEPLDTQPRSQEPPPSSEPFLRKNDEGTRNSMHTMLRHDLPHVRSIVQRWNHISIANAEERAAMLKALDGLLCDLEQVMRQIQAEGTEGAEHGGA